MKPALSVKKCNSIVLYIELIVQLKDKKNKCNLRKRSIIGV